MQGTKIFLLYFVYTTFYNTVVYSLLDSEDDVKLLVSVLKTLRLALDPTVSVQHVQNTILCVAG